MPLITWKDVNERYPETAKYADATQADSAYVAYAVAEIEGRLSQRFAVPFSLNNITARDLAIDATAAKLYRYKDAEKAAEITKYIDGRITALLAGDADMVTADGTVIGASIADLIYSTTEGYHPVFGMSPPELAVVNSAQIIDEEADRGRYY